jgi:hypothetical protein
MMPFLYKSLPYSMGTCHPFFIGTVSTSLSFVLYDARFAEVQNEGRSKCVHKIPIAPTTPTNQPSRRISFHPRAAAVETCKGADDELEALSVGVVVDLIVDVVVGGVIVATGAVTVATGVGNVVLGDTVAGSPLVLTATAVVVVVVPDSSARTCVLV